jgi:hypothetical protein
MNISVEQPLKVPHAALFVRKFEAALEEEKQKRRHFYEIVEENIKMEFINGEIESVVLPDFKIPIRAVFDEAENLNALTKLVSG